MMRFVTLRQCPELKEDAADWFHEKWKVPTKAYLSCMDAFVRGQTEYGWYLCLDGDRIVGGLGVVENDFHDRKDLAPNVCAVYTEADHRCQGIAGRLLQMAVGDLREKAFRRSIWSPTIQASMSVTAGSSCARFRAIMSRSCRECICTDKKTAEGMSLRRFLSFLYLR